MIKSIIIPILITLLTLSCQANNNVPDLQVTSSELSDKEVLDLLFILVYNNDSIRSRKLDKIES